MIQTAVGVQLFGRNVARVAHDDAGFRIVRGIERAGQREIGQFAEAVGAEEDGLGSDAAVHKRLLVNAAQRFQ